MPQQRQRHDAIMGIRFTHAEFATPLYDAALQLRENVLRKPLGIPLRDVDTADDATEELFCALSGERLIACLNLKPVDATTMKLRQMAVEPASQKSGVGSALVRYAEQWARQHGRTHIVLDARAAVTQFYESLGYRIDGDEFVSVGIPHIHMAKTLRAFD